MSCETARSRLRVLWRVNIGLVVALLVCSVTVDMDGEYPLLGRWGSLVVTVLVLGTGNVLNGYLMVVDRKRRIIAGACLVLFVLAILPAIL